MDLETLFKRAVQVLRKRKVLFAVAGGLAAALYRREARLTMDADFAIIAEPDELDVATSTIEALDLQAGTLREADFAGGPQFAIKRRTTRPCMVVGRPKNDASAEGVDILLSVVPWVADAVRRAQENPVDFGFGPVPTLTLEDVIVSKLFALSPGKLRAKDIDDLQSICETSAMFDMAYVAGQMRRFGIIIPRQAEPFLPDAILKVSRDITRSRRRGQA